jgi:NADH-quinone oxidoreductase subunit N
VDYTPYTAMLPVAVIAAAALMLVLLASFHRNHTAALLISLGGVVAAFVTLWLADSTMPLSTPLITVDHYARLFTGLILAATALIIPLLHGYLQKIDQPKEELYIVLLLATLGALVIIISAHFATFLLGLEVLTVSLYVMISYLPESERSLEAGIKYFLLAAASSAFILFGMALIYARTGTMVFAEMSSRLGPLNGINELLFLSGFTLMLTGFGFKLAIVPFHMWTPDIYEGAPAPVSAYVATVSKGTMFAILYRFFLDIRGDDFSAVMVIFSLLAIASMLTGNLLALWQNNVKRILAYSSIAHLGYLLVPLVAGGAMAAESIIFYLVAYMITMIAAFGIVTVLSRHDREPESIEVYQGLYWSRPGLAAIFTAALLSLAGLPLTAGFIGKYLIVTAGIGSAKWLLVIILIVSSVIGLFYYLRIVVVMLSSAPAVEKRAKFGRVRLSSVVTLAIITLLLVGLGIYPVPLIDFIRTSVSTLFL